VLGHRVNRRRELPPFTSSPCRSDCFLSRSIAITCLSPRIPSDPIILFQPMPLPSRESEALLAKMLTPFGTNLVCSPGRILEFSSGSISAGPCVSFCPRLEIRRRDFNALRDILAQVQLRLVVSNPFSSMRYACHALSWRVDTRAFRSDFEEM